MDLRGRLPIQPQAFADALEDGIILCKFINSAVLGRVPPISPEAINIEKLTTYHKIENLNLAIESARSLGCSVVNMHPQNFMEKREHIILGLVWQVIRVHIRNQITIRRHPEIVLLKQGDEDEQFMSRLGVEEILLRWLNWHIRKANRNRVVTNFGRDLMDSEAYGAVFQNVCSGFNGAFWALVKERRAEDVLSYCRQESIITTVLPADIYMGSPRLNLLLCAQIFNQRHGLVVEQKVLIMKVLETIMVQEDSDESITRRIFKNWINSMGIEGVYINDFFYDLRTGYILLKVLDERLLIRCVDWEKYSNKLNQRIFIIQNCNYVLDIVRSRGLANATFGTEGVDIVDMRETLVLGLVWQLCQYYWRERVGAIKDEYLVGWANERVPQQLRITGLRDKSLSNCQFFLALLTSIEPQAVDHSKVRAGRTDDEQIANINYMIGISRRMGAQVMMVWEHVKMVDSRFIYTYLAELHRLAQTYQRR